MAEFEDYNSIWEGEEIDSAVSRALPGGEIDGLLAGNDPKKWGLGTIAKQFSTGDDLNNYTVCGFFGHYDSNTIKSLLNKPPYDFNGGEVELLVIANPHGYLTQILHNSYNGVTAQRDIKGSTVGEWGYVNPLMAIGVEYRTTERYLGKPVYVQAVSVGGLAAATEKGVVVKSSGCKDVIRAYAMGTDSADNRRLTPNNDTDDCTFHCSAVLYKTQADQSVLLVLEASRALTDVVAVAYYTKVAD